MAWKDFTFLTVITFGLLLTNQIAFGSLIRPPAIPPYASTLSIFLSPPPPPLLPAPQILPPALPLAPTPHLTPNLPPSPFNPFVLPPPSVLNGLPILPNPPLLPTPFAANGLRFFSTKGVFPLLPAYPPVFPAPAPILPPAPVLPPAAFPPTLLPAYPAPPAFPPPALPAFPPPALPAFPGLPTFFSAGPNALPFTPLRHLYRRDTKTPK